MKLPATIWVARVNACRGVAVNVRPLQKKACRTVADLQVIRVFAQHNFAIPGVRVRFVKQDLGLANVLPGLKNVNIVVFCGKSATT